MVISLLVFLPQPSGSKNYFVYQFPSILISQDIISPATQASPYILWVWLIPSLCFLSIFLFRLLKLAQFIKMSKKEIIDGNKINVIAQDNTAFSFFNYIFISENLLSEKTASSIILHERFHVKKFHSLDIIFAEFLKVLFWFNPFIWLMKRSLAEIHEFEVDKAVINKGISITEYQNILVNYALNSMTTYSSGFSKILIKKRLMNLNYLKINERKKIMKYVLSTGILLFLLQIAIQPIVFAVNETNPAAQFQELESPPKYKAGDQAMMQQIINEINYPESAKLDGIEGKVFIKFTITKEGKMINAEVLRGVNEAMDAEALRVVKTLKDWIPAKSKDGKNVDAEMTIPIQYKLQPKDK
jgi:TonB family protein